LIQALMRKLISMFKQYPSSASSSVRSPLQLPRRLKLGALLSLGLLLQGCVTYLTPGTGAPMRELVEGDYNVAASRQPAAQFPARLAIVHLQSANYRSYGARGFGDGDFSVVDAREVERAEDFSTMSDWPEVLGIVPLSRALMPTSLRNFDTLRGIAQSAHADILFLYTFDTTFYVERKSFAPNQDITLGVLPGREAHVTSTASGVFIDTNSGFVYGLASGNGAERALMTQWTQPSAADDTRLKAERTAFTQMMQDATAKWKRIAKQFAVTVPMRAEALTPAQPLVFEPVRIPPPPAPVPPPADAPTQPPAEVTTPPPSPSTAPSATPSATPSTAPVPTADTPPILSPGSSPQSSAAPSPSSSSDVLADLPTASTPSP